MLNTVRLILPALFPSWNFFDVIAPSPRIEYRVLPSEKPKDEWIAFRPRPRSTSLWTFVQRLFWNPQRNELLFASACAERLIAEPTQHSEDEIVRLIRADLQNSSMRASAQELQYRLVFVYRDEDRLERETLYESSWLPVSGSTSDRGGSN